MGLFKKVKKVAGKVLGGVSGGLLGGKPKIPEAPKIDAPDYSTLWKTYQGYLDNVNQGVNQEIGEIRARLAAAGASTESITRQVEYLEGQRKSKIDEFELGATASQLREGYEIATGRAANPYKSSLPGQGTKDLPGTMQEYYAKFYGESGAAEARAAENAARSAGGGAAPAAAAPEGGPGSGAQTALSPWIGDDKPLLYW